MSCGEHVQVWCWGCWCWRDATAGAIREISCKPAPQFVLSDGTRTVDLSKLRGKVVLLNLWATWCAGCVEELPSLLALKQQMPDLEVVAVSWDEDPDVYQSVFW